MSLPSHLVLLLTVILYSFLQSIAPVISAYLCSEIVLGNTILGLCNAELESCGSLEITINYNYDTPVIVQEPL